MRASLTVDLNCTHCRGTGVVQQHDLRGADRLALMGTGRTSTPTRELCSCVKPVTKES